MIRKTSFAVCVGLALIAASMAGRSAAGFVADDVYKWRTARLVEANLRTTTALPSRAFLADDLMTSTRRCGSIDPLPLAVLIVAPRCKACDEVARNFRAVANPPFTLGVAVVSIGPSDLAEQLFADGCAVGRPGFLGVVNDVEMYSELTGITGVPTVLALDTSSRIRCVEHGLSSEEGLRSCLAATQTPGASAVFRLRSGAQLPGEVRKR